MTLIVELGTWGGNGNIQSVQCKRFNRWVGWIRSYPNQPEPKQEYNREITDECQSLVQSLKKGWREGVQIKCSGEYNLLYDRLLRITSKQEITNSKGGRQPDKMFRQAERTMRYDSERFQRFDTIQDPRPAIQYDSNDSDSTIQDPRPAIQYDSTIPIPIPTVQ